MKGEHVVMVGDSVVIEEVEVEEVVEAAEATVIRFPRAKVRVPRVPMHYFMPTLFDERAHDLL